MNVYLVSTGDYSDYRIAGIHSTRAAAERHAEFVSGEVEDRVLDDWSDPAPGLVPFCVNMVTDGSVLDVRADGYSTEPRSYWCADPGWIGVAASAHSPTGRSGMCWPATSSTPSRSPTSGASRCWRTVRGRSEMTGTSRRVTFRLVDTELGEDTEMAMNVGVAMDDMLQAYRQFLLAAGYPSGLVDEAIEPD
jgi:hypothetical protein